MQIMIDMRESLTAKLCSFARAYHSNIGKKKIYDDDDGRTIVDMSGVGRRGIFLPRFDKGRASDDSRSDLQNPQRESMSRVDTFRLILGAIGAALLVGGVFVAVYGLVIFLMTVVW